MSNFLGCRSVWLMSWLRKTQLIIIAYFSIESCYFFHLERYMCVLWILLLWCFFFVTENLKLLCILVFCDFTFLSSSRRCCPALAPPSVHPRGQSLRPSLHPLSLSHTPSPPSSRTPSTEEKMEPACVAGSVKKEEGHLLPGKHSWVLLPCFPLFFYMVHYVQRNNKLCMVLVHPIQRKRLFSSFWPKLPCIQGWGPFYLAIHFLK